ncbi:MAG: class III poly(R)-hydroxyalkanoic acid synthase subunit PhaE [Lysobacteraceae bacterium]
MPDAGALAQQYWQAMTDAMRMAGGGAPQDPWRAALDGWTRLAGGTPRNDVADLVERFSAQARQWFGAMQGVAEQFSGRAASAGDIAAAWKQAMGGGQAFGGMFDALGGRGQTGFDAWYVQIAPLLSAMPLGAAFGGLRQDSLHWLQMPAFGPAREHQERWQALAAAMLDLQQKNDDYTQLMLEAGRDAFERFERKLAERSEPGRQLQSARALFDLWIDAAEEAYAEIALSPRFRRVYGDLVNAQMRVRAGVQGEIERMGGLLGLPGRTEVDAAHRRIAELERQVRRLAAGRTAEPVRRPAATSAAPSVDPVSGEPAPEHETPAPARKPRATKAPVVKAVPDKAPAAKKKAATKKAAPKPAAVKQAAVKPAAATARPATRRAPRPAIAAIPMPEPLKPMPAKAAKRTR